MKSRKSRVNQRSAKKQTQKQTHVSRTRNRARYNKNTRGKSTRKRVRSKQTSQRNKNRNSRNKNRNSRNKHRNYRHRKQKFSGGSGLPEVGTPVKWLYPSLNISHGSNYPVMVKKLFDRGSRSNPGDYFVLEFSYDNIGSIRNQAYNLDDEGGEDGEELGERDLIDAQDSDLFINGYILAVWDTPDVKLYEIKLDMKTLIWEFISTPGTATENVVKKLNKKTGNRMDGNSIEIIIKTLAKYLNLRNPANRPFGLKQPQTPLTTEQLRSERARAYSPPPTTPTTPTKTASESPPPSTKTAPTTHPTSGDSDSDVDAAGSGSGSDSDSD